MLSLLLGCNVIIVSYSNYRTRWSFYSLLIIARKVFENHSRSRIFPILQHCEKASFKNRPCFVYKMGRVLVKVSCWRPNWDFLKYFSNTVIFWKSSIIKMEILEGRYNLSGKSSNEAVPLLFTISQFWRTSKWIMVQDRGAKRALLLLLLLYTQIRCVGPFFGCVKVISSRHEALRIQHWMGNTKEFKNPVKFTLRPP